MKIILFITLMSMVMISKQGDTIVIEHIGESDKPIPTVVILRKSIVSSNSDHFIDDNVFEELSSIVEANKNEVEYRKNEFGSFKVIIYYKKNIAFSHCFNRVSSIRLLNELISELERGSKNDKLINELKTTRKRIDFSK